MYHSNGLLNAVLVVRSRARPRALCHNHPSGDPTLSQEDIASTRQLVEAGHILDIELVNHIIIGHQRFVSLKEHLRWE